jgi:putative SOS response-associated peptidase YedK
VLFDRARNLPPPPGIFPDYSAPIVRNTVGGRELAMARWGMPSAVFALKGRNRDPGVTNFRNTASPHRRRWLGPANRRVMPFTSFSENETLPDGRRPPIGSRSARIGGWRSLPAFIPRSGRRFGKSARAK